LVPTTATLYCSLLQLWTTATQVLQLPWSFYNSLGNYFVLQLVVASCSNSLQRLMQLAKATILQQLVVAAPYNSCCNSPGTILRCKSPGKYSTLQLVRGLSTLQLIVATPYNSCCNLQRNYYALHNTRTMSHWNHEPCCYYST
jgi:hypothetical protein